MDNRTLTIWIAAVRDNRLQAWIDPVNLFDHSGDISQPRPEVIIHPRPDPSFDTVFTWWLTSTDFNNIESDNEES